MLEHLLDDLFAFQVDLAGGLVENQERWIAEDGAGQRDPLTLPPRKQTTPRADHCLVARLQPLLDETMGVGLLGGVDHLFARGVGTAITDVVEHGVAEQQRFLRHQADLLAQLTEPHVVSPAGAQGIAQFMPKVARAYGLHNPFDPIHALVVSGKFLRELMAQFGNLGLAAAAYNAGPKRVQDWMAKRGKLPAETRDYVRNITGVPAERWAGAIAAGLRLPALARCPDAATQEAQALERAKPEVKVVQVAAKAPRTPGKKVFILTSAPAGKQVVALPKSALAAKAAAKPALIAKLATKPVLAAKAVPKLALKIMTAEKPAARVHLTHRGETPKALAKPKSNAPRSKTLLASAKPAVKNAAANKKAPAKPAGKRIKFAVASRGS